MLASDQDSLCYGSVCSGIEAVTLAWQPLGLRAAWFSEIDPFACALLAHRYPAVANLGDMTCIAPDVSRGTVVAPDILVGGTPCQSFSVAGQRNGLDDPRGALTLKYVELANAIDKVRSKAGQPSCVAVWENVPGVLSDQDNAFGCFLGVLVGESCALRPAGRSWTNAGCVYGPQRAAAWRVLDAQHFGLAQRRKRVFVVASARGNFDPAAILFERESLCRHPPTRSQERQDTPRVASKSARAPGEGGASQIEPRASEPLSACFGGGKQGAIEHAACLTARGTRLDFNTETFVARAITGEISHALTRAHSVTENGCGRGLPVIAESHVDSEHGWPDKNAPLTLAFAQNSRGELRFENGDGHIVGALSLGGGIPGQGTPTIASVSLQGRARTVRSMIGCEFADTRRGSDPGHVKNHTVLPTLDAHLHCTPHASNDGGKPAYVTWRVRRLMPLECERLQGLPDHYTLVPYHGRPVADGPRYAAIGNSMAVPCVSWLGGRILAVLSPARSPSASGHDTDADLLRTSNAREHTLP